MIPLSLILLVSHAAQVFMEFIKTDINFAKTVALWFVNDTDYCLAGGKKEDTLELRKYYAKVLYVAGDVYKIIDKKPLGFLFIEENQTFHIFTFRKVSGRYLLKSVFDFCFNTLNYKKIFTMVNERLAKGFRRKKVMYDEGYKRLGYNIFSLTKEAKCL